MCNSEMQFIRTDYIRTKYLTPSKDTGHTINLVIYLKPNFWGTVVKCLPMEQQALFDIKSKLEMAFSEALFWQV